MISDHDEKLGISITGRHEDRECSTKLMRFVWVIAAMALLVSLFVVDGSKENQYIYLRAACILYLSLSLSEIEIATRGVRGGMGCLIIILAIGGNSFYVENIPLYIAAAAVETHVVLTVLTHTGGRYHIASGIRGLLILMCAVLCSTCALIAGVLNDPRDLGIARAVVFGITGVPILFLINGIPQLEKDQLVGSFSCLIPVAGAMYLSGELTDFAPWCIAGGGLLAGSLCCMLCITVTKSWRASLMQMLEYAVSGRTTAFFLIIILTFGNIACVNGISMSVEADVWIDTNINNMTFPMMLKGNGGHNPTKIIEEMIPLILLGLAKGGLAIIVIKTLRSDASEVGAWAIATVLCVASLVLLGIEGRGRCLITNTKECAMQRSNGFLSGMLITALGALACFFRAIYTGKYVPWRQAKLKAALAKMLNEYPEPHRTFRMKVKQFIRERLKMSKEMAVALAVGALLTCLISTSYVEIKVIDSMASNRNETSSGELQDIFELRKTQLADYWRTTSWSIAGAVCALAILAVETLPGSPAVAVSIIAGLLLSAGRIHYACLMSYLNQRMNTVGFIYEYTVELNIYIISVISIVVGLAWGAAITDPFRPAIIKERATIGGKCGLIMTINRDAEVKATFRENFEVLEEAGMIEYLLTSGLMRDWSVRKEKNYTTCSWYTTGRCELEDGTYEIYKSSTELIQLAQACAEKIAFLTIVKQVVPVRVFAPLESKESVELQKSTPEGM